MFSRLLGAHSVILMVEGNDQATNQNTQEMITQTIPQVEQSLEFLPKPIKEPPHVIQLTAEAAANEADSRRQQRLPACAEFLAGPVDWRGRMITAR